MNELQKNEIMNDETTFEEFDVLTTNEYNDETSSTSTAKVVAGLIGIGAIALGIRFMAKNNVIDNWMVKRLKKKGYDVKEQEVEFVDSEVYDEEEFEDCTEECK